MRRHIRDLLAGQTKGKTAENRLAEPTSGVLGTHVNPWANCRAFPLCLNANKFVLLSVPTPMTICLKTWAKRLDKREKMYTSSLRRSLACLSLLLNINDGSA